MKYQAYEEYKDSGEEWLGNVPNHWDVIQIKHLSPVKRGASPRPIDDAKYFDDEGEYAWTRIADVTASDVYLTNAPQKLSNLGSSLSVKLKPESLFLSIAGTVGKPCITGIKACIHDGFVYFPELKIPSKFLFYVFAGEQAYKGLGKFGTQLNLNTDTVGGIKIGCTNINELEKIVSFLDHETAKIDTLIEKQQQLIKLLKEKRQAVISHAVTKGLNPNAPMRDSGVEWLGEVPEHWEVTKFKYLGEAQNGLTYSPNDIVEENDGILVLRSSNIQNGKLEFYDNVYVSSKPSKRMITLENDILICSRNGSRALIGKNALIPKSSVGLTYGAFMMIYRSEYNTYLYWVLNSSLFDYQSGSFLTSTINQLTVGNMEGFEIPFPSDETERHQLIDFLNAETQNFEAAVKLAETQVELLIERRVALISAAVTGKIDVRNWEGLGKECAE